MTICFAALALLAAATPKQSILVSGEWLAKHLKDDGLVILHVGSQKDYDGGHIPGARLVTLGDVSVTDQRGLRLELPPVAALEKALGGLGVSDGSRVVVYSGNGSVQSATRVWFTLDYLGLGDRAALLDGGLASWRAEGRAVSTEAASARTRKFAASPSAELVVNAEWVRAHLHDRNVRLLDARLPEFYSGSNAGGMPRAGHIPGARNVPFSSLLAEDGKLQPIEVLRKTFPVESALNVSYCHIGQQATVPYFVARYLGLQARLYDGSFQDWSGRTELPVETEGASLALAARIDAIFSGLTDAKSPGLAVMVRKDGRTIFERGYGAGDLRTFAPIDGRTNFRLASVTKQFTAMAAMLLIHDGKLRYESSLTEIFPDFPAYGRAITVRHLLTHTSGLPDYEDLMEKAKGKVWTATRQIQDEEVLQLLKGQPAGSFAPGTRWSYSNSGYVMLGLIVGKVSGKPFGNFLQERIFEALQMKDTLVYVKGENTVTSRAYGHTRGIAGNFEERDQSSTSATQGDGSVYSNLADLAKWDDGLEKHVLLGREGMGEAFTAVRLADGTQPKWPTAPVEDNLAPGRPVAYGFGWFLDPHGEHPRVWHFGSTTGFRAAIERFGADKVSVVVLCNRTDVDPGKLALEAADVVMGGR